MRRREHAPLLAAGSADATFDCSFFGLIRVIPVKII